jgi:hypothetical protein
LVNYYCTWCVLLLSKIKANVRIKYNKSVLCIWWESTCRNIKGSNIFSSDEVCGNDVGDHPICGFIVKILYLYVWCFEFTQDCIFGLGLEYLKAPNAGSANSCNCSIGDDQLRNFVCNVGKKYFGSKAAIQSEIYSVVTSLVHLQYIRIVQSAGLVWKLQK